MSVTNVETVRPGEEGLEAMQGRANLPVECVEPESDFAEKWVLRPLSFLTDALRHG